MKSKFVFTFLLGATQVLLGCASTHNMKDGADNFWGGGYLVEEDAPGVFRITAKTNVAQWSSYSTARRMWKKHARDACGGDAYVEKNIREYDYEAMPGYYWARYIVTVKEGLAVCQKVE
ncbi:MAG: hypothetical protein GTO67_12915 [Gammaproteobacteria bacterium]|nr:hypothetical protein [Gammaproteobacteria bacterium]NIM74881.1 hypothetical protein [Gammaproteobacteria bacterium]NIN39473.1 hypothetical protein [Gammaproteobacteria bacterium]NIO26799.1 hypothetical protein [Gammaproteobacteria bacterium]NIO67355.1 hypothetical protein [Gammaproteobacteria bacterium]